jgi:hypothetical protein
VVYGNQEVAATLIRKASQSLRTVFQSNSYERTVVVARGRLIEVRHRLGRVLFGQRELGFHGSIGTAPASTYANSLRKWPGHTPLTPTGCTFLPRIGWASTRISPERRLSSALQNVDHRQWSWTYSQACLRLVSGCEALPLRVKNSAGPPPLAIRNTGCEDRLTSTRQI